MNSSLSNQPTDKTCRYLGLQSDPDTAMEYPSLQNYCHHVKLPEVPDTGHQRQFCLGIFHVQCDLYNAISPMTMPAAYRADMARKYSKKLPIIRWLQLVLIFIVVAMIVSWLVLTQRMPDSSPSSSAISNVIQPTIIVSATVQPSVTKTNTPESTPTRKISPTQHHAHMLETPIGTVRRFVIHRIAEGETMSSISKKYHTSVDAVYAVNYNIKSLLFANLYIIVPLNQTDVAGIKPMITYAINSNKTTLESFALQQGVNLDDLCALNGLPPDYLFQLGEWVILPYSPVKPSTTKTSTTSPFLSPTLTPTI